MDYELDQDLPSKLKRIYDKDIIRFGGRYDLDNYDTVQLFGRLRFCIVKDINLKAKEQAACEKKLEHLEAEKKKITEATKQYEWPENEDLENDPRVILGPLATRGEELEK